MKKILIAAAAILALLVVSQISIRWWYQRSDVIEAPQLPGAVEVGSLLHDGLRRSWVTYVPAAKVENAALVLLLHGSGDESDGEEMRVDRTFYRFDTLAEREGFIAVYPDGYQHAWNDCRASASYAANQENIDDVGFLRTLVRLMAADHGIDLSRVYVAGFSNGGQMAYRLGLEAPELVAGIAAIGASLPAEAEFDCSRAGQAQAVLVMNGTADPINPYAGGAVEVFGDASRGQVLSSEDTARYWAGLAGYSGEGKRRVWPERAPDDGTSVESTSWSVEGRLPVTLLSMVGGGHAVPDLEYTMSRWRGPTSHELNSAEVIWSFFKEAGPAAP
jgi:polyhydroxybutyrate depolymerase